MVSVMKKISAVCFVAIIPSILGYNALGAAGTLSPSNPSENASNPGNSSASETQGKPGDPNKPNPTGKNKQKPKPKPVSNNNPKSNDPCNPKPNNSYKPRNSDIPNTSDTHSISGTTVTSEQSGKVVVLDKNTRTHLQAELTMADYTAFAETVTDKMLSSKVVIAWGDKRPKLIVAALRNNTDNESIRMQDVHDRITETILNSGVARLMDISSTDFDYVVRTELSSTRQLGAGKQELAFFKLEFKLFTIDGEMVGQWSDVLPLGKIK